MPIPTLPLGGDLRMPILGFGTYKLQGDACRRAVEQALAVGYRHIDTADYYDNHTAIAEVLKASTTPRHDLFITSKIWRDDLAADRVPVVADRLLRELQTDYLDLLLIHWPNRDIPIAETLGAMQTLRDQGKVRALGVSNFTERHLGEALATGVPIVNNQVELHPSFAQPALRRFCDARAVAVTAYAPLARGGDFDLPVIRDLAAQYGRPPAQIVLAWLRQRGIAAIPKAGSPDHIRSNYGSLEVNLTKAELAGIDAADRDNRTIAPAWNEFGR
jgi:diketogulonate reductase-like aldo/keto reductase